MIQTQWSTLKTFIDSKKLSTQFIELPTYYYILAIDGDLTLQCIIDKDGSTDQTTFETSYKPSGNKKILSSTSPFKSKELANGKKLYRRKHGYQHEVTPGTSALTITVPYDVCKINEAEILWCPEGVKIDLKILDTTTGLLTGVPNYLLNQFGFDINVGKDAYHDISAYDADLMRNMQIEVTFKNDTSITKTVGFNIVFHEIK